ncbi:MAG TPA: hypothetical protein VIC53_08450 [Wenzhouxiangella sp.]
MPHQRHTAPYFSIFPSVCALMMGPALVSTAQAEPYSLSVNVTGLQGTQVKLFDNPVIQYQDQYLKIKLGEAIIEVQDNGVTSIATDLVADDAYVLEIAGQPAMGFEQCVFDDPDAASGTITDASVSVAMTCGMSPTYTVGGTVTGLDQGTLTLTNNAGETIQLTADGSFEFAKTDYLSSRGYQIWAEATNHLCSIDKGFGQIETSNITDVAITCAPKPSTWEAAFCVDSASDFQAALTQSKLNGADTHIKLVKGNYLGSFWLESGETDALIIEGGFDSGCETHDPTPDETILSGQDLLRVLSVRSDGDVTIKSLTIQDGFSKSYRAKDDGQFVENFAGIGGGLRVEVFGSNELNIESVIVQDNMSMTDGAGANLLLQDGVMTIANSVFQNNLACPQCPIRLEVTTDSGVVESGFGPSGGAMWFNVLAGRVDLINNTIYANTSNTGFGGGVRMSMNATGNESYARLFNNLFYDNVAGDEGSDIWMQYDVGSDFVPQNQPVLENNRFDSRQPEGAYADFDFDFNYSEDPGLVDPEAGDLSLKPDSPLVDGGLDESDGGDAEALSLRSTVAAGQQLSGNKRANSSTLPADIKLPALDILGRPRVAGRSVDVGAFEVQEPIFQDRFEVRDP